MKIKMFDDKRRIKLALASRCIESSLEYFRFFCFSTVVLKRNGRAMEMMETGGDRWSNLIFETVS